MFNDLMHIESKVHCLAARPCVRTLRLVACVFVQRLSRTRDTHRQDRSPLAHYQHQSDEERMCNVLKNSHPERRTLSQQEAILTKMCKKTSHKNISQLAAQHTCSTSSYPSARQLHTRSSGPNSSCSHGQLWLVTHKTRSAE